MIPSNLFMYTSFFIVLFLKHEIKYNKGISYSFLGRQLEQFDNGYCCYSGFLLM